MSNTTDFRERMFSPEELRNANYDMPFMPEECVFWGTGWTVDEALQDAFMAVRQQFGENYAWRLLKLYGRSQYNVGVEMRVDIAAHRHH
jgi:hypothetical protein